MLSTVAVLPIKRAHIPPAGASVDDVARALDELQRRHEDALRILRSSPLATNVHIVGQKFTAGQTLTIAHRLGRTWSGFLVTNNSARWDGYATRTTSDDTLIEVTWPTGGTLDFVVF